MRQSNHDSKLRHVVVADNDKIVGVLRVNTAIRQGLENNYTGITLNDVASRDFTIVHEEDDDLFLMLPAVVQFFN